MGRNAPIDGRELQCEREPGNPMDTFAMAVLDQSSTGRISVTVGHVPCLISTVCSVFIRRGGAIVCIVTGPRQYSSDLPQGGLEVPCRYIFRTKDCSLGENAKKVVKDVFNVLWNGRSKAAVNDCSQDDGLLDAVGNNDGPPKAVCNDDGPNAVCNDDGPNAVCNDDGPNAVCNDDGPNAVCNDDGPNAVGNDCPSNAEPTIVVEDEDGSSGKLTVTDDTMNHHAKS